MLNIHHPAPNLFDEMWHANGTIRPEYDAFYSWLKGIPAADYQLARDQADALFRRFGITFAVYGDEAGKERLIPFDLIPRILSQGTWQKLSAGITQRVKALNAFLWDIYHERHILRDGLLPADKILGHAAYRPEMCGVDVPNGVYAHIAGIDLIRNNDGEFYVLEDNLRTPSGVSYMLENRKMMMRLFPHLFNSQAIAPVEQYPNLLLQTLREASFKQEGNSSIAVLTPGHHNSAYFEHAFLAQQMGVELVEGVDLFVKRGKVYMRTTAGSKPVDVIYRRIDDDYLDPLCFRHDSMLGVPGLMQAYREGNVSIVNAVGTGVADDKSIYPFVPEMIRYYLNEEPLLQNVPTWHLSNPQDLGFVLDNLADLVVKEAQGSGGYGMLIGPTASKNEIESYRGRILSDPAAFIAQPTLSLSTCPNVINNTLSSRHIDLRPFVLSGKETRLVAGGLTRVALEEGSLVVNSSQGGGTKDTWILEDKLC